LVEGLVALRHRLRRLALSLAGCRRLVGHLALDRAVDRAQRVSSPGGESEVVPQVWYMAMRVCMLGDAFALSATGRRCKVFLWLANRHSLA
jgi:hypothetical protein